MVSWVSIWDLVLNYEPAVLSFELIQGSFLLQRWCAQG